MERLTSAADTEEENSFSLNSHGTHSSTSERKKYFPLRAFEVYADNNTRVVDPGSCTPSLKILP